MLSARQCVFEEDWLFVGVHRPHPSPLGHTGRLDTLEEDVSRHVPAAVPQAPLSSQCSAGDQLRSLVGNGCGVAGETLKSLFYESVVGRL